MVKYHKKHFILSFLFFVTNSIVFGQKPDTILIFKFPTLPKTNYCVATGKLPTPMCSVYLPENYDEIKKIPVLLWIDGGTGGAGDCVKFVKEKVGANGIILINFPLFKTNIDPLLPDSSNHWTRFRIRNSDSETLWKSYKIMLDSLFSLFPQIDKTNAFMGGFSNGAHAIAILLNRPEHEITNYFNKFFFIEGGDGLEDYSVLKSRYVLYMQGTELSYPNWVKSYYLNAKKNKAKANFVYMKGAGHAFPKVYHKTFRKWISKTMATCSKN